MKALIFSDTHGRINKAIEIIESHKDVNLIIHLGDLVKDAEDLQIIFDNIKVEYVAGNNDFGISVPFEKIIEFGGKKLLITHGHKYRVKCCGDDLTKKGEISCVDVVLYGHTHYSKEETVGGILYLNPGSLTYPENGASYGIIEVRDGKLNWMICRV